jgi:superkiller protein 3
MSILEAFFENILKPFATSIGLGEDSQGLNPQGNCKEDISILHELMLDLLTDHQWQKARLLGECITANSEDAEALFLTGIAWLRLNNTEEAEKYFHNALDLGYETAHVYLLMAHICACHRDFAGQLQWAQKAAAFDNKDPEPYFVIANAHIGLDQLNEAEGALNKIISLNAEDVTTPRKLGHMYLSLGRLDKAANQFQVALELEPEDPSLCADLGHALSRLGQHEDALAVFERALELQPDNPLNCYNVGDTYLALGQADKAIPSLSMATELDPNYSWAYYDLSLAFFKMGRYEDCELASKACLRNDFEMKNQRTNLGLGATDNLGLSYLNQGNYEEAEQCFKRNLKLLAPSYFNLGLALFRQGHFEDSLENFLRAVELEPNDPEYLDLVGNAYSELGRLDEAIEVLNQAIVVDKNYAFAHYDLGTVLAKIEGHDLLALKSFERAIACDSDFSRAYYGIACIYALCGDKKLALQYLEQSFQKGFQNQAHVDADADLDSLRNDPKYIVLRDRYLTGHSE